MRKGYFDIVVEYLSKKQGKIISNTTIKKKLKSILDHDYQDQKMYKVIYFLKNRGYLLNLKKNLFYVKSPEDQLDEINVIEEHYRPILKEHIKESLGNRYYIGGLKALEIDLQSYTIPDEIMLVNQKKQGYETIALEKQALLKNYNTQNKSLFSLFYRHSNNKKIGGQNFRIAAPELAILESLYNTPLLQKPYTEELVKQRLRKNKKRINRDIIETIIKNGKHNSSLNRLANLAEMIDPKINEKCNELIKKYGYLLYD